MTPEERFLAKVRKTSTCWGWGHAKTKGGYGVFWSGERQMLAHRWAFERWVGPIPEGIQIDHTCHDPGTCRTRPCPHRLCVNPAHLKATTPRENTLRSDAPAARWAARTHCENGHEFTFESISWDAGARRCRICRAAAQRTRRAGLGAQVGVHVSEMRRQCPRCGKVSTPGPMALHLRACERGAVTVDLPWVPT